MANPRVRVYMGCSFDGFIAGPENDISWLNQSHAREGDLPADGAALEFPEFMEEVGCILMGRATYGIVETYGEWHYGETPVLVATHRPLDPMADSVRAVSGPIEELVAQARATAGDRDVYLDGGDLVRQALNAGLVDEITATFLPILIGSGVRLFDGLISRRNLQFTRHASYEGGLLQVVADVVN